MADESEKDLDTIVNHFKKKNVHMVVNHPQEYPDTWELEEIENKSDVHGAGSEAIQHLAMAADKHKKHIYLLPAGRKGQQKHLTDYYGRHGFKKFQDPVSGLGLMVRRPGAKMNLDEGAAGSKLSKHSVTCPSCEGKKKEDCKRCKGAGKLEGNVKLPMDKQNTGAKSRIAWIKEAEDHTGKHQDIYFTQKEKDQQLRFIKSKKAHAEGEQIKKYRENLEKDPHHQADMYMSKLKSSIKESIPTNCIGAGAIDTFDPILQIRNANRKDRIKNMWRRKLLSEKP
jgi:hypothetical protein